jgi:Ca-activated chloride channel family protein
VRVVPGQRLDRDFILRWNVAAELVATAGTLVEPDAARAAGLGTGLPNDEAAGDGTFAVTVVPAAAMLATQPARDVVFVVDRSGSMMGWKMLAARRAVARMIDSLSAQDRVAAIAFDHTIEHRGAGLELVPATDRNRWQLVEWLAGIDARGGTELAAALGAGLGLCGAATAEARERFVVLVTDGQVGDEDDVLREMAGKLGSTRLFVVGIDNAVNEGLIARLADASGGLVELVESEARLDDVMDRIQSRIVAPLVTNLRLIGQGIEVVPGSIVPARMPDLVAGVPLVVHGRPTRRSRARRPPASAASGHAAGYDSSRMRMRRAATTTAGTSTFGS